MNPPDTTTPDAKKNTIIGDLLALPNLIKLGGILVALAGSALALSNKLAVSEAKLQDHGERLEKIEGDLNRKTIRDARSDQKLDDLISTVTEIKAGVDQLNQRANRGR